MDQQQDGRQTEREAEGEAQDRDLRVVAEQGGGEHAHPVLALVSEKGRAQRLAACPGHALVGEASRHERIVPLRIGRDQEPADGDARDHQQQGEQQVDAEAAHRRAPFPAEEAPEPRPERGARAIDQEPRALGQRFEIGNERGVERSLAGNGEARRDGPIERGQCQQVFVRKPAHPPRFHATNDAFQPLPVGFPLKPEAVGTQRCLFRRDRLFGRLREPAADLAGDSSRNPVHPILPSRLIAR